MRHFYVRAIAAKQTKQPDKVIDAAMIQANWCRRRSVPNDVARGRWASAGAHEKLTVIGPIGTGAERGVCERCRQGAG